MQTATSSVVDNNDIEVVRSKLTPILIYERLGIYQNVKSHEVKDICIMLL